MDKEKVVLITGGAKRIGACIARYFHAKGFYVKHLILPTVTLNEVKSGFTE